MTADDTPTLQAQIDYYTARAPEYDEWWLRQGHYDRSQEDNAAWFGEAALLEEWVRSLGRHGRVLELACGTGNWTRLLVDQADRLIALDASAAMIGQCRSKLGARASEVAFVQADLFEAEFPVRLDLVFAGFLFSHVPRALRETFLRKCLASLAPGGSLALIDSRSDPKSGSAATSSPAPDIQRRRLNDGRRFEIFKIYDEPDDLRAQLERCGAIEVAVRQTDRFFWYAVCRRSGTLLP